MELISKCKAMLSKREFATLLSTDMSQRIMRAAIVKRLKEEAFEIVDLMLIQHGMRYDGKNLDMCIDQDILELDYFGIRELTRSVTSGQ